jgi:predicted PurR-regulated permease PerM
MLSSVSDRLDRVDEQEVGVTTIDVQAYLQHVTGQTRAGVTADVSRRFTNSLSGFISGQAGLSRVNGVTSLEAMAIGGFRGQF